MNSKNKVFFIILALALVLVLVVGVGYAYFTASVNTTDGNSSIIISTDTLTLTYNGNISTSGTIEKPGDYYTSAFTVENTGTRALNSYDISFTNLTNNILYDEYVYELSCLSYTDYGTGSQAISGTCTGKSETPVPTVAGLMHTSSAIPTGITHEYTLTVTFIDTLTEQDYNQGKSVEFKLVVE